MLDDSTILWYNNNTKERRTLKMRKMEIKLELNSQGELVTAPEEKALLMLVYKGIAMIDCDKLDCEKCPFSSGCVCVLLETEIQLKKLLENN